MNFDTILQQCNAYSDRQRVRNDVYHVLNEVRTLIPKMGKLVLPNGTQCNIVVLSGTVKIFFRGGEYNVPMEIFLSNTYPFNPPKAFVRPTNDMEIKLRHRHVDAEGVVYLPYLHEWGTGYHDLVGLCREMSSVFSKDPPVYARPLGTRQHGGELPVNTIPKEPPEKRVIRQLSEKLQIELNALYHELREDIDVEFKAQRRLLRNEKTQHALEDELNSKISNLQSNIDIVAEKKRMVADAIAKQELEGKEPRTADSYVAPADVYSRQVLELVADNAAIDDTLYYLDRSFADGTSGMDLNTFLREVGRMSRKAFECRALLNKVRNVQFARNAQKQVETEFMIQQQHIEALSPGAYDVALGSQWSTITKSPSPYMQQQSQLSPQYR